MRVFGAESPPFQPSQGRSSKFRTHFSPVTTSAAGQSSGSRSPRAAQAAACSSSLRQRTLLQPNIRLAIRNGCSTRARTLAFAVSALAVALPDPSVWHLLGFLAICHDTSRCARSARFLIPRYPTSAQTCFSSLCRSQSEGVGHDVGGRSPRLCTYKVRDMMRTGFCVQAMKAPTLAGVPSARDTVADRGCDARAILDPVRARGSRPHIPTLSDRKERRSVDPVPAGSAILSGVSSPGSSASRRLPRAAAIWRETSCRPSR